jgi:uncharacterized membrane protein YfcA
VGPAEIAMTVGAAVVIGSLIGSVGIGGVLLVPFLTGIIGMGVRDAVAIAMASYVATGIVAIVQARFTGDWRQLSPYWPLIVATLPGAFGGGLVIAMIPDALALVVLAGFLILSGAWTLMRDRIRGAGRDVGGRPGGITGLVAGFASSVTGTGGPAVLIPILLWRSVPVLAAIALGQMVQLPIALAATIGNVASGPIDWAAAVLVGIALVPGVLVGRWGALRLPLGFLTKLVAVLLVATGVMLAVRAVS